MLKPFVMYEDANCAIEGLEGGFEIKSVLVPYFYDLFDQNNKQMIPQYKITLEPGTDASVTLKRKGDEGFYSVTVSEIDDQWVVESFERYNDCDGVTEQTFNGVSDGGAEVDYNNRSFPTLADRSFVKVKKNYISDRFAEAAGY